MKFNPLNANSTYGFEKIKKLDNYGEWHNQICKAAGIVDNRYPIKGMRVWMPYGNKMMELIHNKFQKMAEEQGAQRFYFPIIIPYEYAKKNESWWKKFEVEGYHVYVKKEKGFEGIGLMRPTGEPAMYPMYSKWIRSKEDLPLKGFQICHNYRKESVTKPLLRDREFWWMEYHSVFETEKQVNEESEKHLDLIKKISNFTAVPVITVIKPKWEVFPGGLFSYENYIVMPDGKTIDGGSINNLGQAYSKKFNIIYEVDNEKKYPFIVCTGYSSRWLAGVLGFHGDDKGLVLPPNIAPFQVIIIPIKKEQNDYCFSLAKSLENKGIRVDVDDRNISVGRKFYDWEIKGVPIRLEVGKKELKNNEVTIFERDILKKTKINIKELNKIIKDLLKKIQDRMFEKAKKQLNNQIKIVDKKEQIMKEINKGNVTKMYWCEKRECYDKIMDLGRGEGLDAFGTDPKKQKKGKCIICGKETNTMIYAANTY